MSPTPISVRRLSGIGLAALIVLAAASAHAAEPAPTVPEISAGFRSLYNLRFDQARATFANWQRSHPDDPLGSASEAASYLFEEFYKQGVLTSEFFLNDKRFLGGITGHSDARLDAAFLAANQRAQDLARRALSANPQDVGALFVMTMATGMHADYASLIEKRQTESVRLVREAEGYAKSLLAVAPDADDAYVALGTGNYIIGSLPGYKRALLRIGGIRGDKPEGMQQLAMAASHGSYLRPFAKITLALAALRERQIGLARSELTELVAEFPRNPVFAQELASLPAVSSASVSRNLAAADR